MCLLPSLPFLPPSSSDGAAHVSAEAMSPSRDDEDDEDDEEYSGGQETMITSPPTRADEFNSSGDSQLAQYTQDTLVIKEDEEAAVRVGV